MLHRLSIVAGFVALMVGAFFAIRWLAIRSKINAELDRIRQAGEPATIDELEAFYAYPAEEDDITALWLDAISPLNQPAFWNAGKEIPFLDGDVQPPIVGSEWPEIAKAKALLDEYATTLEKLHAAAATPGRARYPVDFQKGFEMLLPHVQELSAAVRLLRLEADVRAHHGDAQGACESILAILATGRTLEHEPVLVSLLVRTAIDRRAFEELERLIGIVAFSDARLNQLQDKLRAMQYGRGFYRALLGERVVQAVSFQNGLIAEDTFPGAGWASWQVFGRDAVASYLETMEQLVAASQSDWREANARVRQIADQFQEKVRFRQLMAALFITGYRDALRAASDVVAKGRAADAAIAVELYFRRHGNFPGQLDQLVPEFLPEVPQDPFTGEPLRYLIEEDGYVVYSVGSDGVDDGGKSDDWRGPDIVFRVSKPSAE
jgi:hypothetical protein